MKVSGGGSFLLCRSGAFLRAHAPAAGGKPGPPRPNTGGGWADGVVEAGNGLDVVVEGVGAGVDNGLDGFAISLEIGGQDLDGAAGDLFPDRAYRPGEDGGPAVRELIAVHTRDHGVLQAHLLCGVGDAIGLVEVELGGFAREHGAEAAGSGTDVAEDHEGSGAVVPALADVRAAGLFTYRVQV